MTISEIPKIDAIDLTDDILKNNDQLEVEPKITSAFNKLTRVTAQMAAQSEALQVFPAQVNAATDANRAENAAAATIVSNSLDASAINLVPNNGSFLQRTQFQIDQPNILHTSFAQSQLMKFSTEGFAYRMLNYNGSELDDTKTNGPVEIGRYSANDPNETTHTSDATDFLNRIRQEFSDPSGKYPQYSDPFSIMRVRQGSNTVGSTHQNKYRFFITGGMSTYGDDVTIAFWYRPVTTSAFIQGYGGSVFSFTNPATLANLKSQAVDTFIDGELLDFNFHEIAANKVVHVCVKFRKSSAIGVSHGLIVLLGNVNSYHDIAMLRVSKGTFQAMPERHTRPITSDWQNQRIL